MSEVKTIITGVFGQDGIILAERLLASGHEVFGVSKSGDPNRKISPRHTAVCQNPRFRLVPSDIASFPQVEKLIEGIKPKFIYNLASHSFVADNLVSSKEIFAVSSDAVQNFLRAIVRHSRDTKFFQAGSSEIFGNTTVSPQNEESPFSPRNTYGLAKLQAHDYLRKMASESELFGCEAILFNHESPLRSHRFVSRKISSTVAHIKLGTEDRLRIGNLDASRDWGYAPEYVEGMKLIAEYSSSEIFVLATGISTTVREFVRLAFSAAGIEIAFSGRGLEEVGYEVVSGRVLVQIDPQHYREAEEVPLVGDYTKAKNLLGWEPRTSITRIAQIMVDFDLEATSKKRVI